MNIAEKSKDRGLEYKNGTKRGKNVEKNVTNEKFAFNLLVHNKLIQVKALDIFLGRLNLKFVKSKEILLPFERIGALVNLNLTSCLSFLCFLSFPFWTSSKAFHLNLEYQY